LNTPLHRSHPALQLGNPILRVNGVEIFLQQPLQQARSLPLICGQLIVDLLGRKSLPGKVFSRYGFTFTRVGRNGAEGAWRVGKGEG